MTLKNTERLIKMLRANGVRSFRTLEVQIEFDFNSSAATPIVALTDQSSPTPPDAVEIPPSAASVPPTEMQIPHHLNEVAGLLKLSDEQLVDKMFPDYSQQEPGAS